MAAAVKPIEVRIGEKVQCFSCLPRETDAVLPAPADHQGLAQRIARRPLLLLAKSQVVKKFVKHRRRDIGLQFGANQVCRQAPGPWRELRQQQRTGDRIAGDKWDEGFDATDQPDAGRYGIIKSPPLPAFPETTGIERHHGAQHAASSGQFQYQPCAHGRTHGINTGEPVVAQECRQCIGKRGHRGGAFQRRCFAVAGQVNRNHFAVRRQVF